MRNNHLQYFKPNVLILFIAPLAIVFYLFKENLEIAFSTTGIITFLLVIITKYAWNIRPFCWMFWVDDISGRYEGVLKYQYIDNGIPMEGELKHVKLINQTGYRISVSSFTIKDDNTPSSQSATLGLHVEKTQDEEHFQLVYNYQNTGSLEQNFPSHYGTEIIKIINKQGVKILTGNYFTNRDPQTKGSFIDMKWINNDLTHNF